MSNKQSTFSETMNRRELRVWLGSWQADGVRWALSGKKPLLPPGSGQPGKTSAGTNRSPGDVPATPNGYQTCAAVEIHPQQSFPLQQGELVFLSTSREL